MSKKIRRKGTTTEFRTPIWSTHGYLGTITYARHVLWTGMTIDGICACMYRGMSHAAPGKLRHKLNKLPSSKLSKRDIKAYRILIRCTILSQ